MNKSNSNQRGSTTLQPYLYTLFPTDWSRFASLRPYTPGPPHELDGRFDIVARSMIFSLQYFGCDLENIFRALKSYGFNYTKDPISRYIEIKKLIRHRDEKWHPAGGEINYRTCQSSSASYVTIYYEKGLPTKMTINSVDLQQDCVPKDQIVWTVDGRQIKMRIASGQVSCSILDGNQLRGPVPGSRSKGCDSSDRQRSENYHGHR